MQNPEPGVAHVVFDERYAGWLVGNEGIDSLDAAHPAHGAAANLALVGQDDGAVAALDHLALGFNDGFGRIVEPVRRDTAHGEKCPVGVVKAQAVQDAGAGEHV